MTVERRCETVKPVLLDYQYGLLDAPEAAAVESHAAACPACSAALAEAVGAQRLFAKAAKLPFPDVEFLKPAEAEISKPAVRTSPVWWAVAAGVLLAVGGVSVFPAAERQYRIQAAKPELEAKRAAVADAEKALAEAKQQAEKTASDRAAKLAAARSEQDRVYREWVVADAKQTAGAPFVIGVTGPAAAVPGAPNTYDIRLADAGDAAAKANITATLRAEDGTVKFSQTWPNAAGAKLTLPARLWADLPNGGDCHLTVTATDAGGGTATLVEPVKLLAPVLATFLTTDKPLYRPGEPVFVRSLTLDRTRFLPPPVPPSLRYQVLAPGGKPVESLTATGVTDRGVGNAGFVLPADLPGGEYTLQALEVPADQPGNKPATGAAVVASRTFLVRTYQTEKLLKTLTFDRASYGPGDTVRAKLTAFDQGKPAPAAMYLATTSSTVSEIQDPGRTDATGTATISFRLPANVPQNLSLSVQFLSPHTETIVRPVPLAQRKVALEFFPEGGDLVAGVPNRVYLRATFPNGRPADITGVLLAGAKPICPVQTLTDSDQPGANRGLGVFAFTPEPGLSYAVKLTAPANAEQPQNGYPLPKAVASGVAMTVPTGVTAADEPIRVTLHAAGAKRKLLIGAYVRGVAAAHATADVEPGKPADIALNPGHRGGVVRVTVFDVSEGQDTNPVAERLVYRRPLEQLNLAITADRKAYTPGDGVKIDVAATTETGAPAAAILFASVVSKSVFNQADDRSDRLLPTHFLLAGETQTPHKLEYADFLLTAHAKAAQSLDLLLGTQGWRRFAEQNPDKFHRTVPADDAQQFLISAGVKAPFQGRTLLDDPAAANHRGAYVAASVAVEQVENDTAVERTNKVAAEASAAVITATTALRELESSVGGTLTETATIRAGVAFGIGALALSTLTFVRTAPRSLRFLAGFLATTLGFTAAFAGLISVGSCGSKDAAPTAVAKADAGPPPVTADPAGPTLTRLNVETVGSKPNAGVPTEFKSLDTGLFRGDKLTHSIPPDLFAASPKPPRRPTAELLPPEQRKAAQRVNRKIAAHPAFAVRQYAHTQAAKPDGDATRTDFTETVFWHPLIVAPDDGKTSFRFHLSDDVGAYRVLVSGHTPTGRLGATTATIEVRQPLAVDFTLPAELTVGDKLLLPVSLANETASATDAKLDIWSDALPAVDGDYPLNTPARGVTSTTVPLTVPTKTGTARVRVAARAGSLGDAVERTTVIAADGFPTSAAVNATVRGSHTVAITVPGQLVPGTLRAKLTVHTNALADLQSGLDGLLREPHGCFEQTSSANYPNVLALDYLKESGTAADKHRGLIDRGYARLVSFEVPKRGAAAREGFEWFGQFPPHPALTAYGLVQFADTARVHAVDAGMVQRTKDYLLGLRDGKGGFTTPANGHSFGNAPQAVVNAYIVWALSEAGDGGRLELDAAVQAAGSDSYRLALAAAALANAKDPRAADALKALAALQNESGNLPVPEATIVRSGAADSTTEATALAALAWLKGGPAFLGNARLAAKYLLTRRTPTGTFGATQATVLALKALTALAKLEKRIPESGTVTVRVDGKEIAKVPFSSGDPAPVVVPFDRDDTALSGGAHTVEVVCSGKEEYPFGFTWEARSRKPTSDPACAIDVSAKLEKGELAAGATARVLVRVTNRTAAETGMATAVVGLPAGLQLPADSKGLKKLVEDGVVSHWELTGRELVLYWRGLGPNQAIEVPLDAVAAVPGEFRGPASRAYLYYNPQSVTWAEPLAVRVTPSVR